MCVVHVSKWISLVYLILKLTSQGTFRPFQETDLGKRGKTAAPGENGKLQAVPASLHTLGMENYILEDLILRASCLTARGEAAATHPVTTPGDRRTLRPNYVTHFPGSHLLFVCLVWEPCAVVTSNSDEFLFYICELYAGYHRVKLCWVSGIGKSWINNKGL